MNKAFGVISLLALILVTLVGCAGSYPSDYAGMVNTSGVVLPENVYVENSVSEGENPAFREAILRQGRATVSDMFSLTAAVKTSAEVVKENPAEAAYKRLIASSTFCGEPADQDLYIYRYMYRLSEQAKAKAAGADMQEYSLLTYGMTLEEYRESLIQDVRELLIVTEFCESHGVFYTSRDRANLLDGLEPLFQADEYDLQMLFYRERAMRLLLEEQETPVIMNLSKMPVIPFAFRGNMDQGG